MLQMDAFRSAWLGSARLGPAPLRSALSVCVLSRSSSRGMSREGSVRLTRTTLAWLQVKANFMEVFSERELRLRHFRHVTCPLQNIC